MFAPVPVDRLRSIFGSQNVLTAPEDLLTYSYDGTQVEYPPDAAVLASERDQIATLLRLANELRFPVIPRGAGTGLSGGALPIRGGVALVLTRLNHILEVNTENLVAVLQPGVVTGHFQSEVEKLGLFYPPDPASLKTSTIGGNVAECAGGPRCLKYGTTKDYVLGLEVVLPSGEVTRTGGRVIKNVAGYNLTQLFVGSEGTLGVVTEITVRLIPRPKAKRTLKAVFDRIEQASQAVSDVLAAGILPAALEFMDQTTIRCVEAHLKAGLPVDAEAILVVDVDGEPAGLDGQMTTLAEVVARQGPSDLVAARDAHESDELWAARRAISSSLGRLRPNKIGEDISVPRSAVPVAIRRIQEIGRRHGLTIAIFGHAGDGNLHPNILCDRRDQEEMARVHAAIAEIFELAIEVGGALSGEHGIGLDKKEYLGKNVDPVALRLMRELKGLLDPNGILNPGKMFPSGPAESAGTVHRLGAPFGAVSPVAILGS
ncbi:MAG: FAD-binding protein [Chloroflexi bacterium]|nr:FAD-binding protein [Chloroflexota bacterium]